MFSALMGEVQMRIQITALKIRTKLESALYQKLYGTFFYHTKSISAHTNSIEQTRSLFLTQKE